MRRLLLMAVLLALGVSFRAQAGEVSNNSAVCADILIVFARGSSTNQEHDFIDQPFGPDFPGVEAEAGAFFQKFQTLLDQNYPNVNYKAISVHDIPDKYSARGYPASGIFGISTLNNIINADVSWWPWGDYQQSVNGGTNEVVGYTRDQVSNCPSQSIVMGGYSQGAQVIGESLFWLSESERNKVDGAALFGDPKYIGAETSPLPWQDPEPYPWKRGTAGGRALGIAEARDPYLPDDMKYKTLSWCFDDDFVCSGASGLQWGSKKKNSEGHMRYATFGVPQAAEEIFQRLAPKLYSINKSRGGADETGGASQPVPALPVARPVDAMILVNASAGVNDVLGTLRFHTDNVISPLGSFFSNLRFGLADFSETSSGGTLVTRYNFLQDLKPYSKPASTTQSSELMKNMIQKLAYGTQSGGGVDRADPHNIAIEKIAMKSNWGEEAARHLILITDRPAKNPHVYNICNSSVWTNFHTGSAGAVPLTCTTDPPASAYLSSEHPELCDTVLLVLTQETCQLQMPAPGSVHNITRDISDAIKVARSKKVAISIVVPHDFRPPDSSFTSDPAGQLEYLAKSTGGLYLKYPLFDRASYSDMLWQVLNHKPAQLRLTYKNSADILETHQELEAAKHIIAKVKEPVVFDASGTTLPADTYKWDFDGDGNFEMETDGPNTEHTFSESVDSAVMNVAAFSGGAELMRTTLALTVSNDDQPQEIVTVPGLPAGIVAQEQENGNILVTWTAMEPGVALVIFDPDSGLPVMTVPAEVSSLVIGSEYYSNAKLGIMIVTEFAESERATIEVIAYVPPLEDTEEMPPEKQGLGESDPEGQLNPAGVSHDGAEEAPVQTQEALSEISPVSSLQQAEDGRVAAESTAIPETPPANLATQPTHIADQDSPDYVPWIILVGTGLILTLGLYNLYRLTKN